MSKTKIKTKKRTRNPSNPTANSGSKVSFMKNPATAILSTAGVELKDLGMAVAIPAGTFVGTAVVTRLLTNVIEKKLSKLSFLSKHVGPSVSTLFLVGGWYATKTRKLEKYRKEILAGLFLAWGVQLLKSYLPAALDLLFGHVQVKPQLAQAPVVEPDNRQTITMDGGEYHDVDDAVVTPSNANADELDDEDLTFDVLTASN